MKPLRELLSIIILFITFSLVAQAPEGIHYQAVARDGSGLILDNSNLNVRMTIKENGPAGTTVFQETHNVSTNDFGLFDLTIGQGSVVTGSFSTIDWGSDSHFLQVEVDDGSGYVNLGTSQFVSVPYALYAKSAGGGGGSYTAGTGIDISGNVISNTGDTDPSDDITTSTNAGGDVNGTFSNLVVGRLQGRSISSTAPANGQVLKWNGSAWAPGSDNNTNTTYSAGTGLSLSGTTFTNTGDTDASDDITTSTNATGDLKGAYPGPSVIALQGNQLNAQSPSDKDVLKWDNASSRWVNTPSLWEEVGSLDLRTTRQRVGIGFVQFPSEALHIRTNNSIGDDILLEGQNPSLHLNTTTGGFTGIRFSDVGVREGTLIYNPNSKTIALFRGAMTRPHFVMDSLGNVGIGLDNPTSPLEVNGTATVDTLKHGSFEFLTDGGNYETELNGDLRPTIDNSYDLGRFDYRWDDIYATNGVIQTSDSRDKENITSIEYGIQTIMQLKPLSFKWKSDEYQNRKKIGFLAQDLLPVIPEVVKTEDLQRNEDGTTEVIKLDRYGVYYSDIIPVLVKGIQEQQVEIEKLKKENEELNKVKAKYEELERRIGKLESR